MAKIVYSMSGEGRGHAGRVRALVESLRHDHELELFCPGDAHDFLAPLYAGSEVRVHAMSGLRFAYRGKRLDYVRTVARAARYLLGLRGLVGRLTRQLEADPPDLVITDFEPALPRAARRLGIPFLSVTHQHFLLVNDLSELPASLRAWARVMGAVVRLYYGGERARIVSSFFEAPLRDLPMDVHQVGVMLRPELLAAEPTDGGYLVAYLRRESGDGMVRTLERCGREVRLYGRASSGRRGDVCFRPIDDHAFVRDLAGCTAVVTTAGNQLVGEALSLGKPVLAVPEPGNREQEINAFFLDRTGAGSSAKLGEFTPLVLQRFLERVPEYREVALRGSWDGTARTLELIESYLPENSSRRDPRVAVFA